MILEKVIHFFFGGRSKFRYIETIALIFLMIFALFGFIVSGTIIHELRHRSDLNTFVYENTTMTCGFIVPISVKQLFSVHSIIGLYTYHTRSDLTDIEKQEYNRIDKVTEANAKKAQIPIYILSFLVLIVSMVAIIKYHFLRSEMFKDY